MIPEKHEMTISVLWDDLTGYDKAAASKICDLLKNHGYRIQKITVDAFTGMDINTLGFMVLIPCAACLPAICASTLKAYSCQGGQIFTLGGPLFGRLIKKSDGEWRDAGFDRKFLDPTFTDEMDKIVIEGFVPTYKVYPVSNADRFMTEPDQVIYDSSLETTEGLDILCPAVRPHGLGYGHQRKNRYIPIVQAVGKEGRAQGRRGAAAFMMLSHTEDRNTMTNGTRPGSVNATVVGSAAASIGIKQQDILRIPGASGLLLSMVRHMQRGLFLFEGGSNAFVYREKEKGVVGARILNVSQDFKEVTVRFTVMAGEELLLTKEMPVLAMPRNITDVHFPWDSIPCRDHLRIAVELLHHTGVVDRITHEAAVLVDKKADPEDFVSVRGDNFYLRGEPWYPSGINYWPFYYPGFESADYWSGWMDKSFYDPLEVERDLEFLEGMGINCLFTRLDANVFDRTIPQLLDFLQRCGRHNMKLGLAYPNAMSPLYYNSAAVRKLVSDAGLAENRVIFCYDVIWEFGNAFANDHYRSLWDAHWRKWIDERYGSLENAEADWGVRADRDAEGHVTAPSREQFVHDGEGRILVAAYRRFMDDFISRKWNDAMRDMRRIDPNHLISYRQGSTGPYDVSFTATSKHIDFVCPEGYCIPQGEDGYHISCFISRCLDFTAGNKPIIWGEFGKSLTGVRWTSLEWDHDRMLPPAGSLQMQGAYTEQFYRMAADTMVNGMAPWWWPGGFRRVELSDFGIISPEGKLRPAGEVVKHYAALPKKQRTRPEPEVWMTVDRDAHAGGYWHICFHEGKAFYAAAKKAGKWMGIRTEATGTTSRNTPLLAVGNVPCNGANPPKYLNSEFNYVRLRDTKGRSYEVEKGGVAVVPAGEALYVDMSLGNLQEAEWTAPGPSDGDGCVYIVSTEVSEVEVKIPIPYDVSRYQDVEVAGALLCSGVSTDKYVSLRMKAEKRALFGEIFGFTLKVDNTTAKNMIQSLQK